MILSFFKATFAADAKPPVKPAATKPKTPPKKPTPPPPPVVSFKDLAKSFIIMQTANEKQYLAVAVKMKDGIYAMTSQSAFMDNIPKFRLKTFSGKTLKYKIFEVSTVGDFIRIKLQENAPITPLKIAANAKGKKKVYSIKPDTGIIYSANAGSGNLLTKNFHCFPGAPVINEKGLLVGVASRTDNGLSNKIVIRTAIMKKEKWKEVNARAFAQQVYSLTKLRTLTKSLDALKRINRRNGFLTITPTTHQKLIFLQKDQNQHLFDTRLSKPSGGSMGRAVRQHNARCFHFSSIKKLASFYSSNARTAQKTKWQSTYLKNMGKQLYTKNITVTKQIKKQMTGLVQRYPSIKAKF